MTFKKSEKEIIKAIVKYGGEVKSLAKIINKSKLLENRGIVVAFASNRNYIFFDKEKYDWEAKEGLAYLAEFISLIKHLIDNRYITLINYNVRETYVLGRKTACLARPGIIEIEDARLEVDSNMGNWFGGDGQQAYWSSCHSEQELPISRYLDCWFSVGLELKELVDNDFKTEEQVRFAKQQRLTWISIIIASMIGLSSLIVGVISIIISLNNG